MSFSLFFCVFMRLKVFLLPPPPGFRGPPRPFLFIEEIMDDLFFLLLDSVSLATSRQRPPSPPIFLFFPCKPPGGGGGPLPLLFSSLLRCCFPFSFFFFWTALAWFQVKFLLFFFLFSPSADTFYREQPLFFPFIGEEDANPFFLPLFPPPPVSHEVPAFRRPPFSFFFPFYPPFRNLQTRAFFP